MRIIKNIVFITFFVFLGCSQSENGSGTSLSGIISRAPVGGSRVTFHLPNADGSPGKVIATAKTRKRGAKKGSYRVSIPTKYRDATLVVRAVGGTYEENGEEVQLTELYATLPEDYSKTSSTLNVTTLSDGIFRNWQKNVESGVYAIDQSKEQMKEAAERVLASYGFSSDVGLATVLSIAPASPDADSGSEMALTLRTKMEALKEAARRQGFSGANVEKYLVSVGRDLEDNNGLDGRAGSESLELGENYWDEIDEAEQSWISKKGGEYAKVSPGVWGRRQAPQPSTPAAPAPREPQPEQSAQPEASAGGEQNNNPEVVSGAADSLSCDYFVTEGGNDSSQGTAAAPFKTLQHAIDVAHAAGNSGNKQSVCVAAGNYFEALTWKSRVHLYGGFQKGNWAVRNSKQFTSLVQDPRVQGGRHHRPVSTVYIHGNMSDLNFDGFLIAGPNGPDFTAAMFVSAAYGFTISNCTFYGGAAAVESIGVFDTGASGFGGLFEHNTFMGSTPGRAAAIRTYGVYQYGSYTDYRNNVVMGGQGQNNWGAYLRQLLLSKWSENTILGGQGEESYGAYVTLSVTLEKNTIHGGGGSEASYGVYLKQGGLRIPNVHDNDINGGAGGESVGLYSISVGSKVYRNRIFGGNGRTSSKGVVLNSLSGELYNNLIHGGDSSPWDGDTYGVYMQSSGDWLIRNNTINGGKAGDGTSYGAYWTRARTGYFQNNLIFGDDETTSVGIYFRLAPDAGNIYFEHNGFDLGNGARVAGSLGPYCQSDFDGDDNANTCNLQDLNAIHANLSENIEIDLALEDVDGPDNNLQTMKDNRWSLTANSPVAVTEGALNESPAAFTFSQDFNKSQRTVPWSMGAIEFND